MRRLLLLLLLLGCLLITAVAHSGWKSVQAGSQLAFITSFEGAEFEGLFNQFSVEFCFDPEQPANGTLHVLVDTRSADLDSADINEGMAGADWFAVSSYPQALFHSNVIKRQSANTFIALGELQLKGVRKRIIVPFHWSQQAGNAVMTGTISLQRTNFNIGSGQWADDDSIGLTVRVKFRVLLERDNP